jgi:hypothetical protein
MVLSVVARATVEPQSPTCGVYPPDVDTVGRRIFRLKTYIDGSFVAFGRTA